MDLNESIFGLWEKDFNIFVILLVLLGKLKNIGKFDFTKVPCLRKCQDRDQIFQIIKKVGVELYHNFLRIGWFERNFG